MSTPDFAKPVDVLAFLLNELGFCMCFDFELAIPAVARMLEWCEAGPERKNFTDKYKGDEAGNYYLLIGLLDRAKLVDHGVSVRYPFLRKPGMELLLSLRKFTWEEIENASGEAYDGLWYGRLDD